ncbi:membrane protein insertion efficiency factor YidD [Patescibacteria group bacterium]|nr:membrane protein insertion efficiency factor YidD [Patescibacteria group bacterium]
MIKKASLSIIKLYQKTLSPDHGLLKSFFPHGACKYYPTCSQYAYDAIKKFGIIKGVRFGVKRIIRCNPWSKGGCDPVS